jgi:multidrug efflux system membrane fusion protein
LLTVDNEIDPATGTLKCKAVFANDDGSLFPNQFVNIRLLVELKQDVTLVPAAAIQRGAQQSTFVYVVTQSPPTSDKEKAPDRVIALRPVSTGTSEGDVVEIRQGLQPGEVVVLEGVDRLQEGSRVAVSFAGEKSAPPSGAGPPSNPPRKK